MNKKIIIGAVVIIGMAIVLWFKKTPSKQQIPNTNSTNTQSTTGGIFMSPPDTNSDRITIQTTKGSVVMNNFYKTAEKFWPEGEGYKLKEGDRYIIYYYRKANLFSLDVSSSGRKDFETLRKIVENDFIQTLAISQEEACKLDVSIGSSRTYDPTIDGVEFPLSFCTGN